MANDVQAKRDRLVNYLRSHAKDHYFSVDLAHARNHAKWHYSKVQPVLQLIIELTKSLKQSTEVQDGKQ